MLNLLSTVLALFCFFGFFASSCFAIHLESSVKPVQQWNSSVSGDVVIFPFADYTSSSNFETIYRRNTLIQEAVRDELYRRHIYSAEQDDVQKYFLDRGIIHLEASSNPILPSVTEAFGISGWTTTNIPASSEIQTVGVSPQVLKDIAKHFNVRYALRGRILEDNIESADSFVPYRTGVLPFVFKVGKRILYGFSKPTSYDITRQLNFSDLTQTGGELIQPVVNGAATAGATIFGVSSGHIKEAVIHVRLSLQDLKTGQVVWTNRGQVKASASTFFGENRDRELHTSAIRHTICMLFSTFPAESLLKTTIPGQTFRRQLPETTLDYQILTAPIPATDNHDSEDVFHEDDEADEEMYETSASLVVPTAFLVADNFETPTFRLPHRLRAGFEPQHTNSRTQSAAAALQEAIRRTRQLPDQRINKQLILQDLHEMQQALQG